MGGTHRTWPATAHALPFALLGQRIGRKRVSNQMRAAIPVIYMTFDLLYAGGELTLDLPCANAATASKPSSSASPTAPSPHSNSQPPNPPNRIFSN